MLARSDGTTSVGIISDIVDLTKAALDSNGRVEVRWLRGMPGNTMMIGDPDPRKDRPPKWIHVELFQASVDALMRPSFRVAGFRYPDLRRVYADAYNHLWNNESEKPTQADLDSVTKQFLSSGG